MKDHNEILTPEFIDQIVAAEMTELIELTREEPFSDDPDEAANVRLAARTVREYYGG